MTYASDLGLKVGSRVKVMGGGFGCCFDDGDIIELVEDDGQTNPYFRGGGAPHRKAFSLDRYKWEHYKEPVKVTPKLVWKEMTLEEVKAVQVGDKIRIDGVEDEVIYLYNRVVDDYGFKTKKGHHGCNIVNSSNVEDMEYKFEKLVEETEMNTRLERDREYDVKLTGEELAFATMMTAKLSGCVSSVKNGDIPLTLFRKLKCVMGGFDSYNLTLPSFSIIGKQELVSAWLDKVFTPLETEDQRKLRELKEKHAELGKAIDAMEKR